MKVLKFGGTSVGTPSSMRSVVQIAERLSEPAVIVVSALGGVTDLLIRTAHEASASDMRYAEGISELVKRHTAMINAMVPMSERANTQAFADEMLGQLRDICKGLSLVGELTERSLSMIVAFGERISSKIVAAAIPGAVHIDALDLIRTERWFDKHIAATELTTQLLAKHLSGVKLGHPIVMGGFIARDSRSNQITNLGRGGSDYTAALAAAAVGASELEIWTDVDGFMTADPRIIADAKVLDELSFVESMELCSYGAKVIYPPTIHPVFERSIPIRILNTHRPDAPGTFISDHSCTQRQQRVHGITNLKDCVLVDVSGSAIANMSDSNTRIFNTLARQGVSVLLVSRKAPATSILFALRGTDRDAADEALRKEFAPELSSGGVRSISVHEGVEVVAVVGENIGHNFSVRSRIFNTLEENNIRPLAAAYGNSPTTVSFVTAKNESVRAMTLLHKELIEID